MWWDVAAGLALVGAAEGAAIQATPLAGDAMDISVTRGGLVPAG
jgi:hypothetical protein